MLGFGPTTTFADAYGNMEKFARFVDKENLPKKLSKIAIIRQLFMFFSHIKCFLLQIKIYLYMNNCCYRRVYWAGNSMLQGKDLDFF